MGQVTMWKFFLQNGDACKGKMKQTKQEIKKTSLQRNRRTSDLTTSDKKTDENSKNNTQMINPLSTAVTCL